MTDLRAKLFANVYADPEDDAPRLVLADHLQEIGDPRGEFIALQCSKTGNLKRENALMRKHRKAWLGELAGLASRDTAIFRRGFLAEVYVEYTTPAKARQALDLPIWATVERLKLNSLSESSQELPRTLRAVRSLEFVGDPGLRSLLARPDLRRLRIDEIRFHYLRDLELWRALAKSPLSARLTTIRGVPMRFLSAAPLASRNLRFFAEPLEAGHFELARTRKVVFEDYELGVLTIEGTSLTFQPSDRPEAAGKVHTLAIGAPYLQKLVTTGPASPAVAKLVRSQLAQLPRLTSWDLSSIGGPVGKRQGRAAKAPPPELPTLATHLKLLAWTDAGLIAADGSGYALFDGRDGKLLAHHVTSDFQTAHATSDGKRLLVRNQWFEPRSGKKLGEIAGMDYIRWISRDGRYVRDDHQATVLDTKTGKRLAFPKARPRRLSFRVLDDTARLTCAVRLKEDKLALYDLTTHEPIGEVPGKTIDGGDFSPDGTWMALTDKGILRVTDVATRQARFEHTIDPGWNAVSIMDDKVACSDNFTSVVLDARTGRVLFERRQMASSVALSPDGTKVAYRIDGRLFAVDLAAKKTPTIWSLAV